VGAVPPTRLRVRVDAAAGTPAPLSERPFRLLFSAMTISTFGDAVEHIALAFAVLALPGASAGDSRLRPRHPDRPQHGRVVAGGVISDRVPRNVVLVGSSVLQGTSQAVTAALSSRIPPRSDADPARRRLRRRQRHCDGGRLVRPHPAGDGRRRSCRGPDRRAANAIGAFAIALVCLVATALVPSVCAIRATDEELVATT
jgi:hypothetical protein